VGSSPTIRQLKAVRLGLAVLAFACVCSAPASSAPSTYTARVVAIQDGDTFDALVSERSVLRVRLASVDAPESGHGARRPGQPFAAVAKTRLGQMLARDGGAGSPRVPRNGPARTLGLRCLRAGGVGVQAHGLRGDGLGVLGERGALPAGSRSARGSGQGSRDEGWPLVRSSRACGAVAVAKGLLGWRRMPAGELDGRHASPMRR